MALQKSQQPLLEQALFHYQAGDFLRAIGTLQPGLIEESTVGLFWNRKGVSHYGLGGMQSAMQALEIASTLIPLPIESRVILGECYLSEGRPRWALEEFRSLLNESLSPESLLRINAPAESTLGACRSE